LFGSTILLKISSSLVVKMRQNETFRGIVARMGGFFFGRTEQGPDVFRGEMGIWARQEPRFFV